MQRYASGRSGILLAKRCSVLVVRSSPLHTAKSLFTDDFASDKVTVWDGTGTALFHLYRARGLAGHVIKYTVHSLDLIDDAGHDALQKLIGKVRCSCGHEV